MYMHSCLEASRSGLCSLECSFFRPIWLFRGRRSEVPSSPRSFLVFFFLDLYTSVFVVEALWDQMNDRGQNEAAGATTASLEAHTDDECVWRSSRSLTHGVTFSWIHTKTRHNIQGCNEGFLSINFSHFYWQTPTETSLPSNFSRLI